MRKFSSKSFSEFAGEYRSEVKKVKWVTKQEVWSKAKLVIIASLAMGFLTYAADLIIREMIEVCHALFKWMF